MSLIELFVGQEKRKEYEAEYKKDGLRYAVIKKNLAKLIYEELLPIQERRRELAKRTDYLANIIEDANQKARNVAEQTIAEVKEKFALSIVT
jgi:tryptophanyl-tRNA synthetase